MLTPLVEDGVKQCDRYWPDEGSSLYHVYEVSGTPQQGGRQKVNGGLVFTYEYVNVEMCISYIHERLCVLSSMKKHL